MTELVIAMSVGRSSLTPVSSNGRFAVTPEPSDSVPPGSRTTVNVPLLDALLGGTVTVPTLGEAVRMKIPAGTQHAQRFRLKGKGVQGKGHLHAEIQIEIPKKLSTEARETLEGLRGKLE